MREKQAQLLIVGTRKRLHNPVNAKTIKLKNSMYCIGLVVETDCFFSILASLEEKLFCLMYYILKTISEDVI